MRTRSRCPWSRRLAAAGLLLATGLAGCGDSVSLGVQTDEAKTAPATLREQVEALRDSAGRPDVPVVALGRGAIGEALSLTGELVPIDAAIVRPLMEGQITFLRPVKVGDLVEAGETIAKIDDRDIEDEIERQEQQIEISTRQLSLSQSDLEQKKKDHAFNGELLKEGFSNQTELDRSDLAVRQAEISLSQSQIQLEQEKNRLQKFLRQREKVPIKAPIGGMVVLASHLTSQERSGSLLNEEIMTLDGTMVGSSTELFGIVSQEGYLAQCQANGKDKAKLRPGQRARVTVISHQPIAVAGVVDRIALLQDAQTHAYKAWLTLERADPSFTSGLFVRADVELDRREHALVVEREFVKERNNRSFVQVVNNGRIEDLWVETGLTQEDLVELVTGPEKGAMIVASREVYAPGQEVRPVEVESLATAAAETRVRPEPGTLPLRVRGPAGKEAAVTLMLEDAPASGTRARLRLTMRDVAEQGKAIVFMNDAALDLPTDLIAERTDHGRIAQAAELDLPPGVLVQGENRLRFVVGPLNPWESEAGYSVEGVELTIGGAANAGEGSGDGKREGGDE